jgi:hypothetical protein
MASGSDRSAPQRGVGTPTLAEPADWEPTAGELVRLHVAEESLISTCMASHGLRYVVEVGGGERLAGFRFPHVIDDPGWARRYGYAADSARTVSLARGTSQNSLHLASLTEHDQQVWRRTLFGERPEDLMVVLPSGIRLGASRTGCLAAAHEYLYGDFAAWFRTQAIAMNLPREYRKAVPADPRYQATRQLWAQCMRRAGYPVATPHDARAALPSLPDIAAETRLAEAEATCAQSTGFGELTRRLDTQYSAPSHRPYQQVVRRYRQMLQAAITRSATRAAI